MAKPRKNSTAAHSNNTAQAAAAPGGDVAVRAKPKRTRKSVPRESPSQRSSVYRGVTRHRWTGRFEAHLWDKNSWNESQNKKGKQGAYDDEEAAARAYDLAALKYWGPDTVLNFPASAYEEELKEMEGQSREEYIGSLRRSMKFIHRKSSGFSRGVSKYRGVARHHHNGRWEARIGRVFGNKYLYLGTYATQEEAAMAYDMAAIEYRGLNAVTNFDLSRYIKWLRPGADGMAAAAVAAAQNPHPMLASLVQELPPVDHLQGAEAHFPPPPRTLLGHTPTTSALSLLLQSPKFKEMIERTSAAESSTTTSSSPPPTPSPHRQSSPPPTQQQQAAKYGGASSPQCSFPEDIQTFFGCEDVAGVEYADVDDLFFGDLAAYASPAFHFELDL
ncbi:AP2-like ethylene-responsive transcription factor At1g16060 isoform X2 [Phragmites australis]|uniref:AP2-like ethylene-responsive transcription factor At1g16060 isoform X2 n=1 Tax=Phragmites australis TaxID=29695 RepID=UPI002D7893C9|nr:AP2-like ethylene-responsive transcription factor At1g16060 isoform X2 [Phragmites australis]